MRKMVEENFPFSVGTCKICTREATEEYCEFHKKAYINVIEKYEVWKRALEISWKEYLSSIAMNSYTGSWAKEVAERLIQNLEEKSV